MSNTGTAYELICDEIEAIGAADKRDTDLAVELHRWLRADGRMAREGHATVISEGWVIRHVYATDKVFGCTVARGIFALMPRCEEAHGLDAAKEVAARLIALAVKMEMHEQEQRSPSALRQPQGAGVASRWHSAATLDFGRPSRSASARKLSTAPPADRSALDGPTRPPRNVSISCGLDVHVTCARKAVC